MLFEQRFVAGIRDGSLTLTFRRWKRPQAVAGRRHRTIAGLLEIDAVDVVDAASITDDEARRSGYESAEVMLADLRGTDDLPIYRIAFHPAAGPDPRDVLAAAGVLSDADLAQLDQRLARLDRASSHGPWTTAVLRAIAERPATRAADLAAALGRETQPFKLDVRKLKNLGLTTSLKIGYQLSPRGEAYVRSRLG